MAVNPQNQYMLPQSAYTAQRPRYTPDLESSILGMFGRFGVDPSQYDGGVYADPSARLERIANELRSGQRTFSDVERSLQFAANNYSPEQRRANQTAATEFNPQWQQLNRMLDQLSNNQNRDMSAANMFGERGQEALGQVYGQLGEQFTQNRAAVDSVFQNAQQQVGQAYDQGAQIAQQASQAAQAQNAGLAASLGVQGSQVDPNAELNSTVSEMLQNSGLERGNAMGTLGALQSGNYGINTQAMNDAASEGALRQSQLQIGVGDMLSQIMQQYGQQTFDTQGQLSDLEAQRGGRIAELTNQFQDQSYDRAQQEELNRLAAEIQRGTLDLQRQELGFSREQAGEQNRLNWAQFGLDEELGRGELAIRHQQIQNELATTMDPDRRRQLQLENLLLEQELNRSTTGAGRPGQAGVDAILNSQMGPFPQGQDPRQIFNALRTAAISAASRPGPDGTPNPYGNDPFAAFEYLLSTGSNPAPGLDSLLRQLGETYWNVNG
jgi:hypothetical protein